MNADLILRKWNEHRSAVLFVAVVTMSVAAIVWLAYEFWRLLWQSGYWGAIDLRIAQRQTQEWFSGGYRFLYPPASYVLFWLAHGWMDLSLARWVWCVATIIALAWLVRLLIRASLAESRLERIFIAMIPLSTYALGATIGNGQLGVHVLTVLLAGILWLRKPQPQWRTDLLAAAMIVASLVKPTISAPFFWIVLFVPGRLRPATLAGAGYSVLTIAALMFRSDDVLTLFYQWMARSVPIAAVSGTANFAAWMYVLGLETWIVPGALLILFGLGIWVWRHRDRDVWLLLGVTAIVARLWFYHAWYDDLLLILPMITLFRLAKSEATETQRVSAGILFGITLLFSIAPGGLYLFPAPLNTIYVMVQVVIWITLLIFLINAAASRNQTVTGRLFAQIR